MAYFIWIATAILTIHLAHSYVLLTANLEDVQAIAKQLSASPLSESLNKIWRRAASQFNQQLKSDSQIQPKSLGYMRSNDEAPPQEPAYQGYMKRPNDNVPPQEPKYQSSNNMKTANEDVPPRSQSGSFAPEEQQQQQLQQQQQQPSQQYVPQQQHQVPQQYVPQQQHQVPQQYVPQQQHQVPQQYVPQQQAQQPQQQVSQQYVETIRNDEPLPADDINQDIQQTERGRQSDELVGNERKSSIYLKPLRRIFQNPSV